MDVAVIGGGPAGLIAAERLAGAGAAVTLFDRMGSVGRKFLLAGRGGLNLTHSEPLEAFLSRYAEAAPALRPAVESFDPARLRAWCDGLGQPSFVGSSGRVFPSAFKASPLLRAWLRRLDRLGVAFRLRHRWLGWDGQGALQFETPQGPAQARSRATLLALGGASWARLGSDGAWMDILAQADIPLAPLRPANCGVCHPWPEPFRQRFAGQPLKRIAAAIGTRSARGEALITTGGLEGGVIYALSRPIRDTLDRDGVADLVLDLRPDLDEATLRRRMGGPGLSRANALRRAGLSPAAAWLARTAEGTPKRVTLRVTGLAPIDRAISSAGGIALDALDEGYMIRRRPGLFAAGEMLDWEAPTGGYLLQACFSTGWRAAGGILAWLGR